MTQAPSVVRRRTFEARRHPSGSPERARLNENPVTSEYSPSKLYAYVLAHPATGARCSGSGVTRYRVEAEVEKLLAQGWQDAHEEDAAAPPWSSDYPGRIDVKPLRDRVQLLYDGGAGRG